MKKKKKIRTTGCILFITLNEAMCENRAREIVPGMMIKEKENNENEKCTLTRETSVIEDAAWRWFLTVVHECPSAPLSRELE